MQHNSDFDFDFKAASPSTLKEGNAEPSLPLGQALAQRASTPSCEKPGSSPLRNEVQAPPADDGWQFSKRDIEQARVSAISGSSNSGTLPTQSGPKDAPVGSSSANPLPEDGVKSAYNKALITRVDNFVSALSEPLARQGSVYQKTKKAVLLFLDRFGASADQYANLSNYAVFAAFAAIGNVDAEERMRMSEDLAWSRLASLELAQTKGEEDRAHIKALTQHHISQRRAIDTRGKRFVGEPASAVENERASGVHLLINFKAHKEGASKEPADHDPLIPPLIFRERDSVRLLGFSFPPDRLPEVAYREPGIGLSIDEWEMVPEQFRHHEQDVLALFWDFAYDPLVSKTALKYKRDLALAGEADRVLDWPNKLLLALVEVQEAERQGGPEPVVDTRDIKITKQALSASIIPEDFAECSDTNILIPALHESTNRSYDTAAVQEKSAFPKSVERDLSMDVIRNLTDLCNKYQHSIGLPKIAATPADQMTDTLDKLTELEQRGFGESSDDERQRAMEDATTDKTKDEEGALLVGDSAMGKSTGKKARKRKAKGKNKSESLIDNTATGKGKGKERNTLVEDLTVVKEKGKNDDIPAENATTGNSRAKGNDTLVKDPATGKGKEREFELPMKGPTTGKSKGKEDDLPLKSQPASEGVVSDGKYKQRDHGTQQVLLSKAKSIFLDPNSKGFNREMFDIFDKASQSSVSSTLPKEGNVLCNLDPSALIEEEKKLLEWMKTYDAMEWLIRPRKATSDTLDMFCIMISNPETFIALKPLIEELQWNR